MNQFHKKLLCLLLVLLLAAAALTGCAQSNNTSTEAPKTETIQTEPQAQGSETAVGTVDAPEAVLVVGEGETSFRLKVVFANGKTALYEVQTDAETVGAALSALDLIAGENGLYDTVCDNTLSWEEDHMYWAFYIGEEFAMTGLDDTPVTADGSYSLVATKG